MAKWISHRGESADAPENTEQYTLSRRLDALYGLARKNKLTTESFIKKMAYIEK